MKKTFDFTALMTEVSRETPDDYEASGQQYADFRAVLMNGGAAEIQCRRVVCKLFEWGGFFDTSLPMDGENRVIPENVLVQKGAQALLLKVLASLFTDPKDQPETEDTYDNGN